MLMKKYKYFLILTLFTVLFYGCPYKSAVSISDAKVPINPALLGKWENRSSTSEYYMISKEDDFNYLIEKVSTSGGEPTRYYGFLSVVDGVNFLNVYEKSEYSSAEYYLHKVEIVNENIITVQEVTDNVRETFENSEDLQKFIAANMKNSYFYNKDEATYLKMGK